MKRVHKGHNGTKALPHDRVSPGEHNYFMTVAQVRYIMRKVFRMVDEYAKGLGLDPLAHQALLQVYGSPNQALRVGALAERLDIVKPFASNLVTSLVNAGLLKRGADADDMRVTLVGLTEQGRALCHQIDTGARLRVDALIERLSPKERKFALSSLTFYAGPGATKRRRVPSKVGKSAAQTTNAFVSRRKSI